MLKMKENLRVIKSDDEIDELSKKNTYVRENNENS